MKPEDRSLEITVVGLGQAGGNIAAEFHQRGYRSLALNTAHTDLSALGKGGVYPELPEDRRIYVGLEGYDGAGADPNYGADCIAAHEETIREAVSAEAAGADAVLLCAGLGGGTGSAINELIEVLRHVDTPMIGLVTLPTEAESGIAKVNTVRAINDLVDAPLAAWVFIDNARISGLNEGVSINDYYPHVNETLAEPLDALNRLNETDETVRIIRSFDGEDFRKLLLSGGVVNYGVVGLPEITVDEVGGAFRDMLEASDLMPAGFDISTVSHVGLVVEAPSAVLDATPVATFEAIDERLKAETGGAAVYRGIYGVPSDGTTLRIFCATRSLPHRIRELLAEARTEGLALQEKLAEQLPTLELGEIEGFELHRPESRNRASDRPRRTTRRIQPGLDNMKLDAVRGSPDTPGSSPPRRRPDPQRVRRPARVRRQPSRSKAATSRLRTTEDEAQLPPDAETQSAHEDDMIDAADRTEARGVAAQVFAEVASAKVMLSEVPPDAETSEIDLEEGKAHLRRTQSPPPPPPSDPEDVASPATYDQLVSRYLHAAEEQDRESIAQRLEDDSISEHTVVRYYAVEAMSKLGRDTFGSALLAASEDENDAVRTLALEALRR